MTFHLTSSDRALIAAALEVVNPGEEGQEKRARLLAHIFNIARRAQVTGMTDNTCTCSTSIPDAGAGIAEHKTTR